MSLFGKKEDDQKGKLDDYSESDYYASNEDAHRNVKYELPSQFSQFLTIYKTQLKLIGKSKQYIIFLLLVLMIPVIAYSGLIEMLMGKTLDFFGPGDYAALLMAGIGIMIALIPSIIFSKTLPSEFKERTAYLSMALPQSRVTFYLGKFFACFTVCLAVFFLAYAVIVLISIFEKGSMDGIVIAKSMVPMIAGIFAISCTSFGISTYLKKGSSLMTFFLFFIIIPAIIMILYITTKNDAILDCVSYLPSFSGEVATSVFGDYSNCISLFTMISSLIGGFDISLFANSGAYIIWGVLFLMLGLYKFTRREM